MGGDFRRVVSDDSRGEPNLGDVFARRARLFHAKEIVGASVYFTRVLETSAHEGPSRFLFIQIF